MSDQLDTAALLASLIAQAPDLARRAEANFAPLVAARDTLRARLLDDGAILPVPEQPVTPVASMCAIDGSRVTEKMYAADLVVAVAVTANARSAREALPTSSSTWADIVRHVDGTDRLCEAAMGCQEVMLAASAPHQVRILDGSFVTPIIAMREGLYVKNPDIRDRVADRLLSDWDAPAALAEVFFPSRGTVIAVPKSDSANRYADQYATTYGLTLPVSDRFLAAQVLAPGEMLAPRRLVELANSEVRDPDGSAKVHNAAAVLRASVEQANAAARDGNAFTTYFKPHGAAGAGTVLRFEYLITGDPDPAAPAHAQKRAAILNAETPAPHMLEPFAQWAVDKQAKLISSGTNALRAALIKNLAPAQADAYATFLAQNYRT